MTRYFWFDVLAPCSGLAVRSAHLIRDHFQPRGVIMRRWSIKFLVTLWSRLILLQPLLQHVWFRIWARPPRHFDEAGAKTLNFHPPTLPAPTLDVPLSAALCLHSCLLLRSSSTVYSSSLFAETCTLGYPITTTSSTPTNAADVSPEFSHHGRKLHTSTDVLYVQ